MCQIEWINEELKKWGVWASQGDGMGYGGTTIGQAVRRKEREDGRRTLTESAAMVIDEGHAIVRACLRRNQPGPYQLQAAIHAVHGAAESFEATDWRQIVTLYDHLYSIMATPVVALNRAIAIGEVEGPGAALTAVDAIAAELEGYHLMHATRGTLLRRLGRRDEARAAFDFAARLAPTEPDRRFLARLLEELALPP